MPPPGPRAPAEPGRHAGSGRVCNSEGPARKWHRRVPSARPLAGRHGRTSAAPPRTRHSVSPPAVQPSPSTKRRGHEARLRAPTMSRRCPLPASGPGCSGSPRSRSLRSSPLTGSKAETVGERCRPRDTDRATQSGAATPSRPRGTAGGTPTMVRTRRPRAVVRAPPRPAKPSNGDSCRRESSGGRPDRAAGPGGPPSGIGESHRCGRGQVRPPRV